METTNTRVQSREQQLQAVKRRAIAAEEKRRTQNSNQRGQMRVKAALGHVKGRLEAEGSQRLVGRGLGVRGE